MKALLAIVLSTATLLVAAQGTQGYVVDGSGKIVRTGSDLCLHTGSYNPSNAVKGCDPVVEKKPVVVKTLKSDVLFEFDSAVVTIVGKAALDQVAKNLSTSNKVSIVGHADQIGTNAYNDQLSRSRADAVAMYLNSRVKAVYDPTGVGSSQPTEGSNLCVGIQNQAKLIKCFAPNRRVVITIN